MLRVMRGRTRAMIVGGLSTLALSFASEPAHALLVQPIVLEMKSAGAGSNVQLKVANDRARPVTVELSVQKLDIPRSGAVTLTPDTGADFLIFPPQATIQPGKTQVFRVRWVGDPALDASKFYEITASELPIDMTGKGSGVQLLYSISSVVTVAPADGKPDISVVSVERATGEDKKPGINLTVADASAVHGMISHSYLKLKGANGWSKQMDPSEFGLAVGLGVIPPKGQRVFFVPLDGVPASGALSATLERDPLLK